MISNNIGDNNILNDLNLILLNVPENVETLEKIRWIYIKCGELFSYDYRVAYDINYGKKEIDFSKDYIDRYQTCSQISYILNIMFNNIEGCTSRIIERKADFRGANRLEHVANEITLSTGEKYIMDLTLDLYLIQSGCQTKQFGFTTDSEGTHDIIPISKCKKMDTNLNLIKNNEYTDSKIESLKNELDSFDYSIMSDKEIIEYKIKKIIPIIPKFYGYHESKQFIDKLFSELLHSNYKEYNLSTLDSNNNTKILTCFNIDCNSEPLWYLYDEKLGLIKTNKETLNYMLNSGWETRSQTLKEELYHKKL